MFWRAYKTERSEDFTDAVSELIANNRSAPLFKELSEATEKIKTRRFGQRAGGLTGVIPVDLLSRAATTGTKANRTYVEECLKLLRDKIEGKINPVQFEEGCQYLEEVAGIIRNP